MTSPGDALAAAQRLLATVSPVALALLTDDELGTHLVDVERVGKLVDALRIAAAGELADRSRRSLGAEGLAHRNGCSRPEYLLERITGVSQAEAARRIRVGCDLRPDTALGGGSLPPRFPLVTDAVARGEIGVDAALAITTNLKRAADRADLTLLAAAEASLVDSARMVSADLVAGQARVASRLSGGWLSRCSRRC